MAHKQAGGYAGIEHKAILPSRAEDRLAAEATELAQSDREKLAVKIAKALRKGRSTRAVMGPIGRK